ncbi:hypothetical protein WA158_005294 [Blastocystis sp. Blastoise]
MMKSIQLCLSLKKELIHSVSSRSMSYMSLNYNTLRSRHSELFRYIPDKFKEMMRIKVIKFDEPMPWKCEGYPSHIFLDTFQNQLSRYSQYGEFVCPECFPNKILLRQYLSTVHPRSIAYWDYERNHFIDPWNVYQNSRDQVWWKCPCNEDHHYLQNINTAVRNNFRGCPYCDKQRNTDVETNNESIRNTQSKLLKDLFPEIYEEFDIELNPYLNRDTITAKCNEYVQWKCRHNPTHIWRAQVCNRTKPNSSCPYCNGSYLQTQNSFQALFPRLAEEFDSDLNSLKASEYHPYSNQRVWWKCRENSNHVWEDTISRRTQGSECPICLHDKNKKHPKIYINTLPDFISLIYSNSKNQRNAQWNPKNDAILSIYKSNASLLSENNRDYQSLTTKSRKSLYWYCNKHNYIYKCSVVQMYTAYINGSPKCPLCLKDINMGLLNNHPD